MSHWAKIDDNNIVEYVTVGRNDDPANDEGYSWLINNIGGRWIKTSINTHHGIHILGGTPLRKNFASPGFSYDETRDAFIQPIPHPTWVLNEETCDWDPPVPRPVTEYDYHWDEDLNDWVIEDTLQRQNN